MARTIICNNLSSLLKGNKNKIITQLIKFQYYHHHRSSSSFTINKYYGYSSLISGAIIIGCVYNYLSKHKSLLIDNLSLTVSAAQIYGDSGAIPPSKAFNFIADVAENVTPAVVFIEIKGRHPFSGGIVSVSSGSGFIVSSDGVILTNAHVVANHNIVSVKMHDGRVIEGTVEFIDEHLDLATIRINEKNCPTIKLGDSRKLRAGEWVIALGSPFSLSNTITAGVVSSTQRAGRELGLYQRGIDYIQTDASINVGNSGGPLINLDGEAIGINTMRVTEGISFAIPSVYAIEFLKKAQSKKSSSWFGAKSGPPIPKRKWFIGVTMLTLTPELIEQFRAKDYNFPHVSSGVLVWKVVLGSPAHVEGLQPGDVITHVNDKPADSARDIYNSLDSGKSVRLNIRRKDRSLTINIQPQVVN